MSGRTPERAPEQSGEFQNKVESIQTIYLPALENKMAQIATQIATMRESTDPTTLAKANEIFNMFGNFRAQVDRVGSRLQTILANGELQNVDKGYGTKQDWWGIDFNDNPEINDARSQLRTDIANLTLTSSATLPDSIDLALQTILGEAPRDSHMDAHSRLDARPQVESVDFHRRGTALSSVLTYDETLHGVVARVSGLNSGRLNVRDINQKVVDHLRSNAVVVTTGREIPMNVTDSAGHKLTTRLLEVANEATPDSPLGFVSSTYLVGEASGMNLETQYPTTTPSINVADTRVEGADLDSTAAM